jgi:ATP-dependent DNA helicase RecG
MTSIQQLQEWLSAKEDEHLEFKEAKNNFHFEKLVKYCAALANEGGGSIVLGVTDRRPRKVVGSQAFADLERTKAGLIERLRLRLEVDEIAHPDGRVVVVSTPSRPIGVPIAVEGAYWMRAGEELAPMTPDRLRYIFDESGPDFSAEVCPKATLADLDPAAIDILRARWIGHSGNQELASRTAAQLLKDAELLTQGGVTYAALIMAGTHKALGRFLAQAEVIFEYRSTEASGPANQREEYRQGFLLFYDKLWDTVNLRNDKQHYQDRFVMHEVPTLREGSVREAILNAISHRDYRHPGSIFIRQYPRRIEIVSPGGFPRGINPENILDKQAPRNRRIAESLLRCGLVERSGQGANRMLAECVRDSKPLPDYSPSDEHEVFLRLHGEMQDAAFVKFLANLPPARSVAFSSHHFLVLDHIRRGQPVPRWCRDELDSLRALDLVVSEGRGRGTRYFLNESVYEDADREDGIARQPAPDREASRALLLEHLEDHRQSGSTLADLHQILSFLSRGQLQKLLKDLKAENKIRSVGRTKGGRWYPAEAAD